jgi:RimJ/RimL family protein N-acetyltransferase
VTITAVRLRRATAADAELLARLGATPAIARTVGATTLTDPEAIRAAIARAEADPAAAGRLVVEAPSPVGAVAWSTRNARSRIAEVHGLMVEPSARGRGVGEAALRALVEQLVGELGFHRVEIEAYGFNHTAHRLFERVGFVREGTRRRAYWRHGAWQDSALFALLGDERPRDDRPSS